MSKKVFVGMSGGVDSSVTAALLQADGYDVTGVYMKNWSQDLPGFHCPWQEDYQDAKRVAVSLGIDFKMYDFESVYRTKVVDYMIEAYKAGLTPNPDVMCNQEIKFKLFLDTAINDGADFIATGHYAISRDGQLWCGIDSNKDQSYFLYRLNESALQKSIMPIGTLTKPAVRQMAQKLALATATKKDSQGICFIGNIGIKDFLLAELGEQPHGQVIDQKGRVVGEHDGAIFYTIGQRHGLNLGGGLPYYVTAKNMSSNTIFVTTDLQDESLWHSHLKLSALHWINGKPFPSKKYSIRTRYRAPLNTISTLSPIDDQFWQVELDAAVRATTPGQSAVIYVDQRVVGGGIVV